MVDLMAEGYSQREAAKKLVGEQFDTLRRDYRQIAKSGKLPKPSTDIDQRVAALRVSFDAREEKVRVAELELPAAEMEARALFEVDLGGNLDLLDAMLCSTIQKNEEFLANGADNQREYFLSRRIGPEAAAVHLVEMDQELQHARKQLAALRKFRRLRDAAWRPPQ
jgi:hypothetical protein